MRQQGQFRYLFLAFLFFGLTIVFAFILFGASPAISMTNAQRTLLGVLMFVLMNLATAYFLGRYLRSRNNVKKDESP